MADQPKITCPFCKATSYHPEDIAQRYCGRCHVFTGDVVRMARRDRELAVEFLAMSAGVTQQRAEEMLVGV